MEISVHKMLISGGGPTLCKEVGPLSFETRTNIFNPRFNCLYVRAEPISFCNHSNQ